MSASLAGRRAIVTGAAKSIGRGIAGELAARGAVVVVADKDVESGRRTAGALDGALPREEGEQSGDGPADAGSAGGRRKSGAAVGGGRVLFRELDLADADRLAAAAESVSAELGGIDILVNNAAAVEPLLPLLDLPETEWRRVIDANLTGTFLLSRAAARSMIASGRGGVIINILAIQTASPLPGYAAYCASKGALDALTRSMAVELASHHIRVNGIAVGAVYSDSMRRNLPQDRYPPGQDDYDEVPAELDANARTLTGRLGRPSEIGRAVAFLASDDAAFITGSILTVDGGRLLVRDRDGGARGDR